MEVTAGKMITLSEEEAIPMRELLNLGYTFSSHVDILLSSDAKPVHCEVVFYKKEATNG